MPNLIDSRSAFYGLSISYALDQDRAYSVSMFYNLAAAASNTLGFVINGSPVLLSGFSISTNSSLTKLELFEAGTYTGGTPKTLFNLNRELNRAPTLLSDIKEDVTVSAAGTMIRERNILAPTSGNVVTALMSNSGMILKNTTTYMLTITNNDNGANNYDIELLLSDISNT